MVIKWLNSLQLVYIQSYVTNISLPIMGNTQYDVVSSGIMSKVFRDKNSWEWTKQALITLEEACETYMVEVIAESHCWKYEWIFCRFLSSLLLWQCKEVRYCWNSLTCTWSWIWQKWPTVGFHAPHWSKCNTSSQLLALKSQTKRCAKLSFLGAKKWRLQ